MATQRLKTSSSKAARNWGQRLMEAEESVDHNDSNSMGGDAPTPEQGPRRTVEPLCRQTDVLLGPKGFIGKVILRVIDAWTECYEAAHVTEKAHIVDKLVSDLFSVHRCRFLHCPIDTRTGVPARDSTTGCLVYVNVTDPFKIRNKVMRCLRKTICQKRKSRAENATATATTVTEPMQVSTTITPLPMDQGIFTNDSPQQPQQVSRHARGDSVDWHFDDTPVQVTRFNDSTDSTAMSIVEPNLLSQVLLDPNMFLHATASDSIDNATVQPRPTVAFATGLAVAHQDSQSSITILGAAAAAAAATNHHEAMSISTTAPKDSTTCQQEPQSVEEYLARLSYLEQRVFDLRDNNHAIANRIATIEQQTYW